MENLNETQGQETKTYTKEEVDALLQAETDRRVTSALKKQADKMKEAEKLSKMDTEQRVSYELEQREKAIAERERQLSIAENRATASQILADKGINIGLVDIVVAEDAETTNNNIKLLEKYFKDSVKTEVEKRLQGNAPKVAPTDPKTITSKDIAKMSLQELSALHETNPELFNKE